MPYIVPTARHRLDALIDLLAAEMTQEGREGELNYAITRLVNRLYKPSYSDYNNAIGVLECAKLELYRRAVAPYEDKKAAQNGDVYNNRTY